MKRIMFFLVLFLIGTKTSAQTNLDSLFSVWEDIKQTDSLRIKAYHKYIWTGYMFSQPDSALVYAGELQNFAQKNNYRWAIANTFHLKAHAHYVKGDFQKALDVYFQSLEFRNKVIEKREMAATLGNMSIIYKEQADYLSALKFERESLGLSQDINDQKYIGVSLNNIGVIYHLQGLYDKALDYYTRSLKIREEIGDRQRIATSFNNIASIYSNMGNHSKALQYLHNAVSIREESNNKFALAGNLTNIAVEYNALKEYDSAIIYNQRSLDIAKEIGNKSGTGWSLHNQGNVYKSLNDYDKALSHFEKSIEIMQETGESKGLVTIRSLIDIGIIDYEKGNYDKSISRCLTALKQAKELDVIKEQKLACNCLYVAFKALGYSKKALTYHEQMLMLNDSLKVQETSKKLQQMEFAKQVLADSLVQVEKDLQVEMVHQSEVRKKDKNKNMALGAGIFFFVLSGGFYSRWRYVKKSRSIIKKEKDRSENLLLNILPAEIAEELKLKGRADARDFDLVSILFTDFKGFTKASEKLSAKELISEINHCFMAFDHICEKHSIEKIKTIGDSFMAAGGLPVPSDDAVKNVVLAALDMQAFITSRILEKQANNEAPFTMRLGIHSGPVVAGIVGVKKFQYDIWGDTVNTASRMESSGEIGKVNISQDTYTLIKDDPHFSFEARGKIQAKGKGEIDMYFVTKVL